MLTIRAEFQNKVPEQNAFDTCHISGRREGSIWAELYLARFGETSVEVFNNEASSPPRHYIKHSELKRNEQPKSSSMIREGFYTEL